MKFLSRKERGKVTPLARNIKMASCQKIRGVLLLWLRPVSETCRKTGKCCPAANGDFDVEHTLFVSVTCISCIWEAGCIGSSHLKSGREVLLLYSPCVTKTAYKAIPASAERHITVATSFSECHHGIHGIRTFGAKVIFLLNSEGVFLLALPPTTDSLTTPRATAPKIVYHFLYLLLSN